jgi:hypothetical protein
MFNRVKNLPFVATVVRLYQSMLAHRQPPAPHHIGPYGGSFLDLHEPR